MNNNNETFGKFIDDMGDEYYCPLNSVKDDQHVSEWELDDCVEATTAGRYSGNLNVVDRFKE